MHRMKKKIVEEYWLKKLSGELPGVALPLIAAGKESKADTREEKQARQHLQEIPTTLSAKLTKAARNSDMALFILVLSGLNIVLARYTGIDDLVVGTVTPAADENSSRVVFCRSRILGGIAIKEFIKKTKEDVLKSINYSGYHPDDLVEMLKVRNNTDSINIFNTAFIYEPFQKKNQYLDRFELLFILSSQNGRLCLQTRHPSGPGSQGLFKRFSQNLITALERILDISNQTINKLDILNPGEKDRLLYDFNRTEAGYPKEKTVHRLFEEQAGKTSHHTALVGVHETHEKNEKNYNMSYMSYLSYKELNQRANRLANLLREKRVGPDSVVAIMMERSIEMIVSLLGILKAGGAYLPIDPGYPQERIDFMLKDSNAKILLTLDAINRVPTPRHLSFHPSTLLPFYPSHSLNLAYIIYTSGTTGKPKGVTIEHVSAVNILTALSKKYPLSSRDTYLLKTTYVFDVSVTELFGWFFGGSRLAILEKGAEKDPGKILDTIEHLRITHINFVPSMFNVLLEILNPGNIHKLLSLKYIFLAGEALLPASVKKFNRFKTGILLENIYGPTESTIYAGSYSLSAWKEKGTIPIGKPLPNVRLYILDRHDHLQPLGVPGELCIGGAGLARGYLNRPGLTAERFCLRRPGAPRRGGPICCANRLCWFSFIPGAGRDMMRNSLPIFPSSHLPNSSASLFSPPHKNFLLEGAHKDHMQSCNHAAMQYFHHPIPPSPHSTIYRTGDLACWLPNGNIEFFGRIDYQVKVRGYRIELGEIESQLAKHPGIKETVVTTIETIDDKQLCAYVVPRVSHAASTGKRFKTSELKNYLLRYLPEYMVPSYFVRLDNMPLTPNGKIDRGALPAPGLQVDETYTAPRDEIEKKLVEIWSKVLGIEKEKIGINDNFFHLGGHSLNATILASRIHKELKVNVPFSRIFKTPHIRGLAAFIKNAETQRFFSIEAVEKKDYYILSSSQRRLFFLQRMDETGTAYNMPSVWQLEGDLDIKKLAAVFQRLIQRHESLRTSFYMVNDEPVQRIERDTEGTKGLAPSHRGSARRAVNSFIRAFDLSRAPLFRVGLIDQEKGKNILMVDMHHIISDGMSTGILVREFMDLYSGKGRPALRIQYKDYSQWQYRRGLEKTIKLQEAYWLKEFSREIPVLNLPTDYPRPAVRDFAGDSIAFEIHRQETDDLRSLADERGVTLFMLLLAIYTVCLTKLCGQEDIVVGTPIAGRRHADIEPIMGMFVNNLALWNFPEGQKPFTQFLEEVKENTVKALENQDYLYENLVDKVAVNRDIGRNPLFDTVFTLQNLNTMEIEIPGLQLSPYEYENKTSKFDLTLSGTELENKILLTFEYSDKLFKEETIRRFTGYFTKTVSTVIHGPGTRISDIEIIDEDEKNRILHEFNDTAADYPKDKTIHRLFEERAERTPDHAALHGCMIARMHEEDVSITYKELNKESGLLAYTLIEKGVCPDTVVGIMIERSVEMIIGILAILKAGGAYMPIDPDYPGERIDFMLKDSGAKILVTDPGFTKKSEKLSIVNCQLLMVNDKPSYRRRLNKPPKEANSINNYQLTINNLQLKQTHLAYIIYTSGTTGRPKGVLIQHENVVRLLFNDKNSFDFNRGDVWTMFHSSCFDFSVWEMYGALLYGGQLLVIPKMAARDPGIFSGILKEKGVTVLNQTPPAFYNLVDIELKNPKKELNIRFVIFGGGALKPGKLKDWKEKYPQTKLVNMYGITETTVHVTFKEIGNDEIESGIGNIGKPIPTMTAYIIDRDRGLQPIGVAGELVVGGKGVARGYLNRPELTAEKFDRDLWDYHDEKLLRGVQGGGFLEKSPPGRRRQKIYKSGDLARWLVNGEMEYLGRIDHQVKIRGFRVELGEIETQLTGHEDIKEAVVISKENENSDQYLCAYIVSHKKFNVSQLREYLAGKLPDYMIPSYFVQVDHVPLTPNGKIDGKALEANNLKLGAGVEYAAPKNEIEKIIANIWKKELNLDKVGIYDNFFELGGNSLNVLHIINKLKEALEQDISLVDIFTYPTIDSLYRHLKQDEADEIFSNEKIEESADMMEDAMQLLMGDEDE